MLGGEPLSSLGRFYIYALHGFATEVVFTAGWEFVVNINWKFPGNTSMWSFLIYGLSCLVIERMYLYMKPKGVPLLVRAFIYTLWTYAWEFSCGFLLKQFDACPWDYTPFDGDFMGLITLEYLPAWFFGNIILDLVLLNFTRRLLWSSPQPLVNGDLKQKDN